MDRLAHELLVERAAHRLSAEQFRTFRRLARELEAHAGRWGLFLLRYEHESDRQKTVQAIDALCARPTRVAAEGSRFAHWTDLEAELVRLANTADLIHVFGLDDWLVDGSDPALAEARARAWNVRRDGFARDVPVPVLCWLHAATLKQLARMAPDLWSWRAGVHSFATHPDEETATLPLRTIAPQMGPIDNRTVGQRTQRLHDIRQYLDKNQASDEAALTLRSQLLDELASLHASIGQLDEALRIYREEQLPVFDDLGDVRSKAITQGKIADILQVWGRLDEALHIRKKEELPVFERLGDVRAKAVTHGKIADILQFRGCFDKALRIRKKEELPVYERLGDVREKAITHGKIADILQARGRLDEALRIREQEELPVYERLGDVRSKAVTQGKIADILQLRGRLDEALRIREEEELPVYERLGDVRSKAMTQSRIADILHARGRFDEALALHALCLPVAERMSDLDGIAHIKFSTASIRFQRGDHTTGGWQAIHDDLAEAFSINRRIGRADAVARVGALLAQVLVLGGLNDEASSVLEAVQAAYFTLGDKAGWSRIRTLRDQLTARKAAE